MHLDFKTFEMLRWLFGYRRPVAPSTTLFTLVATTFSVAADNEAALAASAGHRGNEDVMFPRLLWR